MIISTRSGRDLANLRADDKIKFVAKIKAALEKAKQMDGDTRTLAAEALGISRRTLFRWMKEEGIT